MKIIFYDTKPYDRIWFEPLFEERGFEVKFLEYRLNNETVIFSKGFDVVCVFVNDDVSASVVNELYKNGVRLIALRSAGYNNVDYKEAYKKIHIVRVPEYSPAAVAEHAAALLLTLNRKIHKAYIRTKESNFSINGLMGMDLRGKTVGIIGTGKIGFVFSEICRGFGMKITAYDPYPLEGTDIEYQPIERILSDSDIISLHCPLTKETHHIINEDSISTMKQGVIIINTSRGGLIDTTALIEGLKNEKIGGSGLDVYEEESEFFFEDLSASIIKDDELARLLTFPNVLLTSHQGFFTREAMEAIAKITCDNICRFEKGETLENEICYRCGETCKKEEGHKQCFD